MAAALAPAFAGFASLMALALSPPAAAARLGMMRDRHVDGEPMHVERPLDELLDVGELLALVRAAQRQRVAGRAGAARAADPVHVVLGVERQVEVDDRRQFHDVETARGDVGRDERLRGGAYASLDAFYADATQAWARKVAQLPVA